MLISIIGMDSAGDILLRHWQSLQLPCNGILRKDSVGTSMTSYIFNQGMLYTTEPASASIFHAHCTLTELQQRAPDCCRLLVQLGM